MTNAQLELALAAYNEIWQNSGPIDADNAEEVRRNAMSAALAALPPSQEVPARTCATCHAILADGPQPAATYTAVPQRDRDGIARIIDHYAFATANWERPDIQFKQTQAFAKADAIIALSRHQPQCAPDPSEEIAIRAAQIDERWRQAMRDLRELAIDEGNKKIERRCFDLIMVGPAHTRPEPQTASAPIPEYWIKCPSCGFVGRDMLSVSRPDGGAPDDNRCMEDMTLAHNARQAAIEECARHVETTGLRNPDNIARDIRALAVARPDRNPTENIEGGA